MGNPESDFIRPHRQKSSENPLSELPALYEAALSEFSQKSFQSASLNDIIKAGALSKGSFYHRFSDKLDLYLCMMDLLTQGKMAHLAKNYRGASFPEGFFEQLRFITRVSLSYAKSEPRFYALWRQHLSESPEVRKAVRDAFPSRGKEDFGQIILSAFEKGQFRPGLKAEFIKSIVELLFYNMDFLIRQDMSEEEILGVADGIMDVLRNGLERKED